MADEPPEEDDHREESLADIREFQTLEPEEAVALWRNGREVWNAWVDQNPRFNVSFHEVQFKNYIHVSFRGYRFPRGLVDFSGASFQGSNVDFGNTTFQWGAVNFSGASFSDGAVNFANALFESDLIIFEDVKFELQHLDFSNTHFGSGDLSFRNSHFKVGTALFCNARFGATITHFHDLEIKCERFDFSNATIDGELNFQGCEIKAEKISFSRAQFRGHADFRFVVFDDSYLDFTDAMFYGLVEFDHSLFRKGKVSFYRSKFEDKASFGEPGYEGARNYFKYGKIQTTRFSFHLAKFGDAVTIEASFNCIPDLRGTKFTNHLDLSRLYCSPRLGWLRTLDYEDESRARRLRELAEASKDHRSALRFFAAEQRAARWRHLSSIPGDLMDLVYDVASNYGQSVLRPLIGLSFTFIGCKWAYETIHLKLCGRANGISCLNGVVVGQESLITSLTNVIPFVPSARSARMHAADALFGNNAPAIIDYLMLAQGLISFVFLFLIGLALRNRFRI